MRSTPSEVVPPRCHPASGAAGRTGRAVESPGRAVAERSRLAARALRLLRFVASKLDVEALAVPAQPLRGRSPRLEAGRRWLPSCQGGHLVSQCMDFKAVETQRAIGWKQRTAVLCEAARAPAPYGASEGPHHPFCLPREYATLNLLPEVRDTVLALFAELGIPWHKGVNGGPGNHLLSSQVQCANALGQMVREPDRLRRAFGATLGIGEVLEIEPGRYLTFEYIGPTDYFGEAAGGQRIRGAQCTSVDAAFLHRSLDGRRELVLVEWKYTESYARLRPPDPQKDAVRRERYAAALEAVDGPVRAEVLPFWELLDEPFYQLLRQQLLARELERSRVLGAERVRVVHVLPAENEAYQRSLVRPSHRALGATVRELWQRLLRLPDRFVSLDSRAFLDPAVTSAEYVDRYGGPEA